MTYVDVSTYPGSHWMRFPFVSEIPSVNALWEAKYDKVVVNGKTLGGSTIYDTSSFGTYALIDSGPLSSLSVTVILRADSSTGQARAPSSARKTSSKRSTSSSTSTPAAAKSLATRSSTFRSSSVGKSSLWIRWIGCRPVKGTLASSCSRCVSFAVFRSVDGADRRLAARYLAFFRYQLHFLDPGRRIHVRLPAHSLSSIALNPSSSPAGKTSSRTSPTVPPSNHQPPKSVSSPPPPPPSPPLASPPSSPLPSPAPSPPARRLTTASERSRLLRGLLPSRTRLVRGLGWVMRRRRWRRRRGCRIRRAALREGCQRRSWRGL